MARATAPADELRSPPPCNAAAARAQRHFTRFAAPRPGCAARNARDEGVARARRVDRLDRLRRRCAPALRARRRLASLGPALHDDERIVARKRSRAVSRAIVARRSGPRPRRRSGKAVSAAPRVNQARKFAGPISRRNSAEAGSTADGNIARPRDRRAARRLRAAQRGDEGIPGEMNVVRFGDQRVRNIFLAQGVIGATIGEKAALAG